MGPANEINVVLLEELLDDGLSEGVGDATIVLTPTRLALLGVRPEQVTKQTILGHLSRSSDLLKLSNCDELG